MRILRLEFLRRHLNHWRELWSKWDCYALPRRVWTAVAQWWSDRRTRHLIQGLPALIAISSVVATLAWVFMLGEHGSEIKAAYQRRAEQSLSTQPVEALTCYERLVDTDDSRPEYVFGLAQACEANKLHQRALGLLNQLAPLWTVRATPPLTITWRSCLLAPGQISTETLAEAERHLVRVVEQEPNAVGAHVLLAQIYLVSDRPALAKPELILASAVRPEFHLILARLYNTQGEKSSAILEAKQGQTIFRARCEANADDHDARLNWAEAAAILGNYAEAAEILRRGLALSQKPLYSQALAQLFVAWSDTLIDDPAKKKLGKRIALIDQGLRYDPDNLNLLARLQLIGCLEGTEAEKARKALQDLLAEGHESAAVYLTLGIDAAQRGQPGEAALHFERAFELSPEMPLIANNLAWSLATREPIDLPRALKLADTALRQAPAQPQFHGTRGRILFKMERWKDALPELLQAVRSEPTNSDAHAMLATIYTNLGAPEMAKTHRDLAAFKDKNRAAERPAGAMR